MLPQSSHNWPQRSRHAPSTFPKRSHGTCFSCSAEVRAASSSSMSSRRLLHSACSRSRCMASWPEQAISSSSCSSSPARTCSNWTQRCSDAWALCCSWWGGGEWSGTDRQGQKERQTADVIIGYALGKMEKQGSVVTLVGSYYLSALSSQWFLCCLSAWELICKLVLGCVSLIAWAGGR